MAAFYLSSINEPLHPTNMTTKNSIHDIGVASQIGQYSDAVETTSGGRLLFLSGTPGLAPDGKLPDTFEGQAEQAWKNVIALLENAGMGPEHLVKVTQYLTNAEDIPKYKPIRSKYLTDNRPAFMLAVVSGLVSPDFLIEIEAYAAFPNK
jgi:enamine deaminase RidA (YjgF/YER057c/UK114 family)